VIDGKGTGNRLGDDVNIQLQGIKFFERNMQGLADRPHNGFFSEKTLFIACHFQVQGEEKVRDFIVKYQDRLMYATDFGIRDESDLEEMISEIGQEWKDDWRYFSTEEMMSNPKIPNDYRGLGFDNEVLRKIYYDNVFQWFPEVFK